MSRLPRYLCLQISRFFSVNLLFKLNTPFFLPFYHVVSDKKLHFIQNYPYRNRVEFEKELDFFLKYFKPVPLEYLVKNPFSKEKIFHLTFDDGLKECAEIVAPILLRKGIPATFFINTAFMENKALFHKYKASLVLNELKKKSNPEVEAILGGAGFSEENILNIPISLASVLTEAAKDLAIDFDAFLKTEEPYLTNQQILNLEEQGFTIGAHSHNHPEFWNISTDEQLRQIKMSMDRINELVQPKIKAFAFPFTDDGISATVLEKIHRENICDITFGTAGLKHDTYDFHFQRYPVEISGDFVQNIKAEWVYYFLRKWFGKATVKH